jgi:hypothetical protein
MSDFNPINDLSILIEKYGSDKFLSHYTECYHAVFKDIRPEIKTVLEIGIGSLLNVPSSAMGFTRNHPHYTPGGSLRAWRDYFPNAQVIGVDIAEDCRITEDRIDSMIFSSTDAFQCHENLGDQKFDIIIDDGLHLAFAQLTTLRNLFPYVVDGGFYCVEDMSGGGDGREMYAYYLKEVTDIIGKHEYFYRGNLIIVKKNYSGKGDMGRDGHALPSREFSPLNTHKPW